MSTVLGSESINNLEVVSLILDNDREKARLKIKKMPYSLKKIKFCPNRIYSIC